VSGADGLPKLVSTDVDHILELGDHAAALDRQKARDLTHRAMSVAMDIQDSDAAAFENLVIVEPIEDFACIPAKQLSVIRTFLEDRKPTA
jgi:hypothetical protein